MMFKTLPIVLLLTVGNCQNNDDLLLSLVQMYGPIRPVANNQAFDTAQGQNYATPASYLNGAFKGDLSCTLPYGQAGECVPYYQCRDSGNRVIDLDSNDRICPSYVEICCPFDRIDIPMNRPPNPGQSQREGCGWANPDGVGEQRSVTNNEFTKFGEFPWMVAIVEAVPLNYNEPNGQTYDMYVGGGSLIHPSVVLTAAHYVVSTRALKIRAGEWDTQATTEIYPYQERSVVSVETHEDFIKENEFYDIAVLFLDKSVDLAPNVGVVCLPPARIPQKENTRCFTTGWGKDKYGSGGRYQVILKKVELPVVRHDICEAALRTTRLGKYFQLHSSFMCAGGEPGKDACTGDGGAPLSCPIEYAKDRYVQSGIVAWGIGCGVGGLPGVYVDVSNLRNWIDNKVLGKGYDPRIYTF